VQRCQDAGADIIDVNPGHIPKRKLNRVEFLVKATQEATDKRLMIDSPNPMVLERAARVCNNRPILNGLSKEKDKLEKIGPLAKDLDTDLVILLMDERSYSPPGLEQKIALCLEIAEQAFSAGLVLERLIFDPIMPSLAWQDAHSRIAANLALVRMLSSGALFSEPVRTMIGLSNLRSGMRSSVPYEVEEAALFAFMGAGLTMALADVLRQRFMTGFKMVGQWVD
jgi:cobalamin-dependent methionine synthase I